VAAHSRAVAFREGTVIVEVDSAAWISELGYLKRRIAGELNRRLGGDIVHDIRLQPAASPPRTSRPQKP
jgi:predicted nucleic acid-binding Zn ribbon protein